MLLFAVYLHTKDKQRLFTLKFLLPHSRLEITLTVRHAGSSHTDAAGAAVWTRLSGATRSVRLLRVADSNCAAPSPKAVINILLPA